jgi:hypothetical protein
MRSLFSVVCRRLASVLTTEGVGPELLHLEQQEINGATGCTSCLGSTLIPDRMYRPRGTSHSVGRFTKELPGRVIRRVFRASD